MVPVARTIDFGVTTLGSGGPYANAHRASSAYCIWIAGRPSLLLDAGGGAFSRLGQLEIPVAQIDTIAFTHTHIDHTGGIAPIVFAATMLERQRPFCFVGPTGHAKAPGAKRFIDLLFGPEGAWSYLHTFDAFAFNVHEVASAVHPLDGVFELPIGDPEFRLRAVAVRHGGMPAVAYRVDRGGHSIVYSGDVSEESDGLVELARDCDLLIHDLALPERIVPHGELHAKPSAVGRVAARSGCKRLMVSHIMPMLEDELVGAIASVRTEYSGEIIEARDLFTLEL